MISVVIAELLRRRNERIEALAEASRTLAVRALEAEESERRRLAYGLHDEPIQQLLSAQLDLDRAARGDTEAAESARTAVKKTISQLRETIFDLYPSSLEQLGLATALEQLASRAADRSGAEIELEIRPEATGSLDGLLFTAGRELLRNAVEHSGAELIRIELAAEDGEAVLVVADDGRGIDRGSARAGAARGSPRDRLGARAGRGARRQLQARQRARRRHDRDRAPAARREPAVRQALGGRQLRRPTRLPRPGAARGTWPRVPRGVGSGSGRQRSGAAIGSP